MAEPRERGRSVGWSVIMQGQTTAELRYCCLKIQVKITGLDWIAVLYSRILTESTKYKDKHEIFGLMPVECSRMLVVL